jgi:uncharacterized repeat protein (TIGR03803 family)
VFKFDGSDGEHPSAALIQAVDGNLYGTTAVGDANNGGVIFKYSAGKEKVVYSFCAQLSCADGGGPVAMLVQADDGNFYGTTEFGGSGSPCAFAPTCGTVFRMTPGGTYTTLYSFCSLPNCADGALPLAELVQAEDGNLYGTTAVGGNSSGPVCGPGGAGGCGTIFKITLQGALTTLYSFCSQPNCADGYFDEAPCRRSGYCRRGRELSGSGG